MGVRRDSSGDEMESMLRGMRDLARAPSATGSNHALDSERLAAGAAVHKRRKARAPTIPRLTISALDWNAALDLLADMAAALQDVETRCPRAPRDMLAACRTLRDARTRLIKRAPSRVVLP